MLAACKAQHWPLDSYRRPDHPLQAEVLRTVLFVTALPEVHVGVDGCGVPVHGMPLRAMALIYARLAVPNRWGDLEPHVRRAVTAMRDEPYMVAGRNRIDTAVMEAAADVVVKGGAEGLTCAASLDGALGVAVKVRDGSPRASGPALIHALGLLGILADDQMGTLQAFRRPAVLGGGEPVGELRADFELEQA
jgi:L-asparaginase II